MSGGKRFQARLMGGAAFAALMFGGVAAAAEPVKFDIAPQPLTAALNEFGIQSSRAVLFTTDLTDAKLTQGVNKEAEPEVVLAQMLAGTGLSYRRSGETFLIVRADDPQGGSAAGGGAGTVEALIVTAQKREEDIQDVPIAISAFSQEDLTTHQIAGGPDLITQVPNMTFTKTNFSSYSIQLRGIGTQAISATTDPAVAVAFNNTPFIRNHFFEQEFYDLQRVEVLRGPQGTLYGRNATAGVVNVISQKPKFVTEAKASADVSNFNSSRIEGMVNIPLAEDKVALRVAGAWTKREGYATNQLNGNPIDGRDLWSTRVSLRFAPSDRFDANLIWEHFEENDDRLRSGKQLCDKDVVTEVAGIPTPDYYQTLPETGQSALWAGVQASFSQGCKRNSLYSPDMYQTVNGLMLPYYVPLGGIGLPITGGGLSAPDPYVSTVQSPDLRVIESTIDPEYQAKADLGELQVSFDITDNLTLSSETSYSADTIYSLQDFNRFNTAPGAWSQPEDYGGRPGVLEHGPNGGIFCDPQLGCSDRLIAVDIATADSRQFSQEFRLSSDFDGRFNFSLGSNFLRYDTEDKYYVFINSLSLIAAVGPVFNTYPPYVGGQSANLECMNGPLFGDPNDIYAVSGCIYIDPNPIGSLNDRGHNYFLSKNPYKLISYAVFGEAYYNITDALKVTAGLRWTVDKKEAPRVPSWVLATVSVGYPVAEVIEQEWREPTGRLAIDWKPDLPFTDDTLLYASFAHGYKAGGANPPGFVRVYYADTEAAEAQTSATKPKTFDPEFIEAFELGAKNTLFDGSLTLNLAAFYYDYTGYQVSEIVDRSAFNRNFDATVWGLEIEADWRPLENLKLGFKGGYEKTRIADGEQAIDLMDRTAGDPNFTLHRPFPTFASSCILPTYMFVGTAGAVDQVVNVGGVGGGNPGGCELAFAQGLDPVTRLPYVANPTIGAPGGSSLGFYDISGPDRYPGFNPFDPYINNGEGIFKQLGGNELPNAPDMTATITADYTIPLPNEWLATLHTDLHWQSESWWRVFNDHEYDKLDEYFTMNLAAIFTNEEAGWNIMAYVKNVTDVTAITGAFLNSDDTGLTTNVFLTEPRLYGLRVTKNFTGGPLLGGFGQRRDGPSPFTLELGGQMQRFDAPNEHVEPAFMDEFPSAIDPRRLQDKDLGWSGGGSVKLTYSPREDWKVALGLRYGKTKGSENVLDRQLDMVGCQFGQAAYCDPENPPAPGVDKYLIHAVDWAESRIVEREDYDVADFTIGRDVGLGMLTTSTLSGGLRYAHFNSSTIHNLDGTPDWQIPVEYAFYYNEQHHLYHAELDAEREFKGAGPAISWEASRRLFGLGDAGGVDLAWELSAGVLFGKQRTDITGEVTDSYYDDKYANTAFFQVGDLPISVTPSEIDIHRSQSVTVPTFSTSLGLSYSVGGTSIGAGYRWERYFDVIDGGYDEVKDADRTIDGPYFKIAVGFGG